ncbi:hypothetical protein D917_06168 [Trichinella nativa]|uniref:Uncharacterized protein n=1 Tax=Trichinella nativa TaxID=6335 RepID=A0A1Y3EX22_9BILA|nr:hypothetical protein D917_06168 [Trichinella nativa]
MSADKSSLAASSFESSLEVPRGASASVENESNTLNVHKQILPEIQSSCSDLSFYSKRINAFISTYKKQFDKQSLFYFNSSFSLEIEYSNSSSIIKDEATTGLFSSPTLSSIGYSNDSPILHYQRNVHFINSEEIYFTSEEPQESNTGKYASTCSPFKNCIKSPRRYTFNLLQIHDFQVTGDCISVPQEIQFTHSYQQPTISTQLEWMLTSNEFDRPHIADSQNTPTDACNNTNNASDPNRRATFRRSIRASFDDFAGRLSVRYCGGDPIFFTSTFSTIG